MAFLSHDWGAAEGTKPPNTSASLRIVKEASFCGKKKKESVIVIVVFTELFRARLDFAVLERMSSYLSQIFLPTIPQIPLIIYWQFCHLELLEIKQKKINAIPKFWTWPLMLLVKLLAIVPSSPFYWAWPETSWGSSCGSTVLLPSHFPYLYLCRPRHSVTPRPGFSSSLRLALQSSRLVFPLWLEEQRNVWGM